MPTVLDEFIFKIRYEADVASLDRARRRAAMQTDLLNKRIAAGATGLTKEQRGKIMADAKTLSHQLQRFNIDSAKSAAEMNFLHSRGIAQKQQGLAIDREQNLAIVRREAQLRKVQRIRRRILREQNQAVRANWRSFESSALSGFHQLDMAASRFSGAIFRIGLLLAGVGYGFYNAVRGVVRAQEEITQARIGIGALYGAMTGTSTPDAMAFSAKTIEELRMDAAKGVGDLPDYLRTYQQLIAPAVKAGADPGTMRDLTKQGIAMAYALRGQEGMNLIGYDLQQALTMGVTERTTPMINLALRTIDMTNEAFNKLAVPERVKRLKEALSNFDEVVKVMGQTWTAQWDTLRENVRQLIRLSTDKLFKQWTVELRELNDWFEKNSDSVERWADQVGDRLVDAWHKFRGVLLSLNKIVNDNLGGWERVIKGLAAALSVLFVLRITALIASVTLPVLGASKAFVDAAVHAWRFTAALKAAGAAARAAGISIAALEGSVAMPAIIPITIAAAVLLVVLAEIAALFSAIVILYDDLYAAIYGGDSLMGSFITWLMRGTPAMKQLGVAMASFITAFRPWGQIIYDVFNGISGWVTFGAPYVLYFLERALFLIVAIGAELMRMTGLTGLYQISGMGLGAIGRGVQASYGGQNMHGRAGIQNQWDIKVTATTDEMGSSVKNAVRGAAEDATRLQMLQILDSG